MVMHMHNLAIPQIRMELVRCCIILGQARVSSQLSMAQVQVITHLTCTELFARAATVATQSSHTAREFLLYTDKRVV